ncbi:hypothetical protein RhiirC2_710553 [Rhizophagus irregularis]|uniref:Uncharacterized protein n=1 Tax=Rhizophagus irregularis TaxID=588596 RepID=A0A2N1NE64_9GLOM|nr:hypothetical protein RhiirC2_710553 [Rhizophagus irregularis]
MILKKAQDVNGRRTYLNSTDGQVYLLYFLVENTDKFFGGVGACTLGHASIKSLGQATKQCWDTRQYLWEFLTLRLWVDLTLASLGGPDYAHARDWKKEKKVKPVDGTSVHFHQVTDSSVIGINNGSFDVSRKPKKSTGKRKSIRYHYTESSDEEDHSSDSDYTEKPERKQESRRSKRLRGKANCDDMDKGDIIVETSEDENTSHPTQPTMISNTSEDTTLCEITPSTPQQLNTSEGFATSRESTPCPTVHSATSTLIATPNKPIITKSTYDEFSAHIICAFNTTKLWLSSVCVSSLAIALIAILRTQKTLKPIVSRS